MNLNGKVVLLTGGKRIGAAVAQAAAAAGADVALTFNRSKTEADETAAAIRAAGRRALIVQADVSNEQACADLIASVDREFGRLDVLVNMASLYHAIPFDQMTSADFDRQLGVDLRATFLLSHASLPLLRRAGGGRIINFSDWLVASGRPRYKGYLGYYVAKAGVKALTEALALELAGDNILVNAIAPGPILAPPGTTDEEVEAVGKATPLGRWGGPEAIVQAVMGFIGSDFITGETLRVDGGRHLS
jgi:NAD(P)-dependent dehydrogenase (short-subunit alcohol dehydrogenase family)